MAGFRSFVLALLASSALASYVKLDYKLDKRAGDRLVARSRPINIPLPELEPEKLAYNIEVTVGTPPQRLTVTFDTGSSDLVIPDGQACKSTEKVCQKYGMFEPRKSSTFKQILNESLEISYGAGSAEAYLSADTISVGGHKVPHQGLYVATKFIGQAGEGIMGVGYATGEFAAKADGNLKFPSIVDNLFTSGAIARRAFSVYLDDQAALTGSVLFGGIDMAKYTPPLTTIDITPNATGAYDRYAVDVSTITFQAEGGSPITLSPSGMSSRYTIDSGESQFQFPPAIAEAIWAGLGAVSAPSAPLGPALKYTDCAYAKSKASFGFQLGGPSGPTIAVPVSSVIGMPTVDSVKFGDGQLACPVLLQSQSDAVTEQLGTYILGNPFMRAAYVVFDQDNNQISVAQAKFDDKSANIVPIPSGSGLPGVSSTATGLATAFPAPAPTASSGASASASPSAPPAGSASAKGKPPHSADAPSFSLGVPVATRV